MTHRRDWWLLGRCLVFAMLLWSGAGFAGIDQWTGGGPSKGDVSAVAVSPLDAGIVYAGVSRSGLYKSINSGNNWIATSLKESDIRQIVMDPIAPDTVYVLFDKGIVKSKDGGNTWSDNISPSSYNQTLAIDPINTSLLYLGTRYGLYKSMDGGLSWIGKSQGLTSFDITSMAVHPSNPAMLYITTREQGVFRTENGAETWVQAGLPNKITYSIAYDRQSVPHIYAATREDIFVSTDNGATWTPTNMPSGNGLMIAADQTQTDVIYIARAGNGIYKANTNSHEWAYANTGLTDKSVTSLAVNGNVVYAGTDGNGVFRSDNSGGDWQATALLNYAADVRALTEAPGNPNILYAGTIKDGIFKSVDKGATWQYLASTPMRMFDVHMITVDPVTPSTLFIAGDNMGLYVSRNEGTTWTPINTRLSNNHIRAMAVFPAITSTMLVGTENGVYRSVNSGGTWEGDLLGKSVTALAIEGTTTNIAYVGTTQAGLYKTLDRGVTWQPVSGPDASISALAISGTSLFVGTPTAGIFKSTDGGMTWTQPRNNFAGIRINRIKSDRNNGSLLFAATDNGVFYTVDSGDNWLPVPAGPVALAQDLVIDSTAGITVHAGTAAAGVQSYTFSQLTAPTPVSAPAIAAKVEPDQSGGGGGLVALLSLQALLFTLLLRLRCDTCT